MYFAWLMQLWMQTEKEEISKKIWTIFCLGDLPSKENNKTINSMKNRH
jgi:hypothetical protein